MTHQRWIVMVDDNFHFSDTSERYMDGEYTTYEDAIAKCKQIVSSYLKSAIKPDMTADELYNSYLMFGEDPYILGPSQHKFSAWAYAKEKAHELV